MTYIKTAENKPTYVYKCIRSVWFILYLRTFSILSKIDSIVQLSLLAIKMLGVICRPFAKIHC